MLLQYQISLSFYLEILGFRIQSQREEEGLAMIERQGSWIMPDKIGQDSAIKTKRIWISASMELPVVSQKNGLADKVA
jgi:hypothetical protein